MGSYESILARMKEAYEAASGQGLEEVSDAGLRLRVLAGEVYRLQTELEWLKRQAFPDTATGEWLDRHGVQRGVARREAERAQGKITFSRYLPLSFDLVIPAGTVCAVPGDELLEYKTLADGVIEAGKLSVEIPAQAMEGGRKGNAGAGYINTLETSFSGVNYVSNKAPFTGGRDRESDEEYRIRVMAAYTDPSNGVNAAWYRNTALAFPGVSAAGVIPRENGSGTVGVYVWGKDGPPEDGVLSGLAAEFSQKREIGVTVTVQAASAKAVDVKVRLKLKPGTEFDRATADVKQALSLYFAGLTVGSPVYLTELERVVLNAAPAVKLEFPVSMRDVSAATGVIPLLGTVTVEELT